jgi:NAD+ synthase (glutamine-hydrolysing)
VADGFERAVVRDLARRTDQAEARRQQISPCLKITPRAFGPGRRLPIAQRFSEW